jgi:hypothetical protein
MLRIKDEAVSLLYPNMVIVRDNTYYDTDENIISIDESLVVAKVKELEAQYEADKIKAKEKADRQDILTAGTLTDDGLFWFNEEWSKVFMTKVLSAENVGFTYVKWKNAKREVVQVPLPKAKEYIKEMIAILDKIYLG